MKIKVTDIKINGISFTEAKFIRMYIPTEDNLPDMIGWLKEYEQKSCTAEDALHMFIRTELLYSSYRLTYKMTIARETEELTDLNDYIMADIIDQTYTAYNRVSVTIKLPEYVVVDTDNLMFTDYSEDADDIKQNVFELLLHELKVDVISIEHK